MLLANLGEGLSRFASVADNVFTLGLLSPDAGLLLGSELPKIKRLLVEAQVQLGQLNETILSSTSKGDGISLLSVVSGALGSPTLPLQREESLLATGVQTVDFLMYFLGHESPKKYLLVGQNDDEIRATGGFIGVVAELTVDKGDLTGLIFYDSTTVDSPPTIPTRYHRRPSTDIYGWASSYSVTATGTPTSLPRQPNWRTCMSAARA